MVAAPHREAPPSRPRSPTRSSPMTTLPLLLAGFFGGSLEPTGGGTAQTWAFKPASETIDPIDLFTYEFGDDVLTDWYQFGDGILDSVEFTGPDGLGPVSDVDVRRFGSVRSTGCHRRARGRRRPDARPDAPTPTPPSCTSRTWRSTSPTPRPGSLPVRSATRCTTSRSACRATSMRSATPTAPRRFDVDAYVRTSRLIELECTFAKTDDTVGTGSESDAWISDQSVDRYIRLTFTSTASAAGRPACRLLVDDHYADAVLHPHRGRGRRQLRRRPDRPARGSTRPSPTASSTAPSSAPPTARRSASPGPSRGRHDRVPLPAHGGRGHPPPGRRYRRPPRPARLPRGHDGPQGDRTGQRGRPGRRRGDPSRDDRVVLRAGHRGVDAHRRQGQARARVAGHHPRAAAGVGDGPGAGVRHRRRSRWALHGRGAAPFTEQGLGLLAAYADGTIDVSAEGLPGKPRRPSKPSSTTSTPMAAIATTTSSRAGASSTSPSVT